MKKCPSCLNENPDSARYCAVCGYELSFRPKCPYCDAYVTPNSKFCTSCGMSLDPEDQPTDFEIETAFWLSHKKTIFGQNEYLKRYPKGYYRNEIDMERIERMNRPVQKDPKEIAKEKRRESVNSVRKTVAIFLYAIGIICLILFLLLGREGAQLLGIPSGAAIWFTGRIFDPDVKSF